MGGFLRGCCRMSSWARRCWKRGSGSTTLRCPTRLAHGARESWRRDAARGRGLGHARGRRAGHAHDL